MDIKVILNGKLYSMGQEEYKKLLKVILNYVPERTIYALEGFGMTEVVNKSYKNKSSLKRAIKSFERENIKVYYKE